MLSPIIQARLSQLLVTSLYEDRGNGTFQLIDEIDLKRPPWFWPAVSEIRCKQKNITYGGPLGDGSSMFRRGVQPRTPPSGWTDVLDQGEDGRTILVGRIPHWDEFWSGSPPLTLKKEIPHAEVDSFLNSLLRGSQASVRSFFEDRPLRLDERMPPRQLLGMFPTGPYRGDVPRGADPHGPLDPRKPDTGPELRPGDGSNCWERICCIGLDVEKKEATAIVEITQSAGYGGDLCASTAFESVGFWLIQPSRAEIVANQWPDAPSPNPNSTQPGDYCGGNVRFLGAKRIPVADVPRSEKGQAECLNPIFHYEAGSLRYSVSVPLSEDDLDLMKKCTDGSPRLPVLHAVVAWNTDVTNENFGGRGLRFGDWDSDVVQYPVATVKKLAREIAVGLLSDECPYVRYSNVVWPKEVKGLEWSSTGERIENPPPVQLDTMAIDVTAAIKDKIRAHGAMRVFVVDADYENKLLRRRIVLPIDRVRTTDLIGLNEVPANSVLTPFDLDVGEWLICASFAQTTDVITWDPERDIVLSGYGESITTSCVGLYEDLRKSGVRMAGPVTSQPFQVTYRRLATDLFGEVLGFPPCIRNFENPPTEVSESINFVAYFPVSIGSEGSLEDLQNELSGAAQVVMICMANGSADSGSYYAAYAKIIEQFVFMNCIVVLSDHSLRKSAYFIYDVLPSIEDELKTLFPRMSSFEFVLFGHSNGGNQVRYAISRDALRYSEETDRRIPKVRGGILLAPALVGNSVEISTAPSLMIAGGLDSQVPYYLFPCTDEAGRLTGSMMTVPYSPITAWEQGSASRSYFLFVKGATHYRWLRRSDDLSAFEGYPDPLIQALALDGEDPFTPQPKFPQRHAALLLSYASYFIMAFMHGRKNFQQLLVPAQDSPPDIRRFHDWRQVSDSYSRFYKTNSRASINSLKDDGTVSSYRGSSVVRTIYADGVKTPAFEMGPMQEFVEESVVAPFREDFVMLRAHSLRFEFTLQPGLEVSFRHYLSLYLASIPDFFEDGAAFRRVQVSLEFDSGVTFEVDIDRSILSTPGYQVPRRRSKMSGGRVAIQGATLLATQVVVPVSWSLASCAWGGTSELRAKVTRVVVNLVASSPRGQIGCGKLQVLSS